MNAVAGSDGKLELSRDDFNIVLLLISMFIVGLIIGPSITLPDIFTNSDIVGIFILLIPILMIFLMLTNFQNQSKRNIPIIIREEE